MDFVLPAALDAPVWSALNGGWRHLAQGDEAALRLDPAIGPFAAARDEAPDSLLALAALCAPGEEIWLVQRARIAPPPGLDVVATPELLQMAAPALTPGEHSIDYIELGAADGAEMHALASMTRPGPFEARTHELGGFIGMRSGGRLIAMAGERMRPEDLPADTATQMGWIYAGLMVSIGVLAAVGLRRYAIDRASHEARLALLGGGEPAHKERS